MLSMLIAVLIPVFAGGTETKRAGIQVAMRPSDELLHLLVEAALSEDPIVESFEVVVSVLDGAVQLNGVVDTEDERARAGAVAADVEGVTEVDNKITVDKRIERLRKPDGAVQQQLVAAIEEAFGEQGVEITVEDGLVTITGTVSSPDVKRRISEMAFRSGALLVRNRLELQAQSETRKKPD